MITLDAVTKEYNGKKAVDALTIAVKEGEVFGLLGPNGAGKTTTMKMLLGLTRPSSGQIHIGKHGAGDLQAKKLIEYLPEVVQMYRHLTAWELLNFFGELFRMPRRDRKKRNERVLKLVGLHKDAWHRSVKTYSKGMQQRLGIAQALIHDPQIVMLDEPMSGLDPLGRHEVKDIILALKKAGKTVLLNSHILADVEQMCDRVAILHHGQLMTSGTVKQVAGRKSLEDAFVAAITNSAAKKPARKTSKKSETTAKPEPKAAAKKSSAKAATATKSKTSKTVSKKK